MPDSVGSDENPIPSCKNRPRTWLLTSGATPLAIYLARALLGNGDYVAAGMTNEDRDNPTESFHQYMELALEYLEDDPAKHGPGSFKALNLDITSKKECTEAVAEVRGMWGGLDVLLCCTSEALVGTIEEVAQRQRSQTIVKKQFRLNYFGNVNMIMAAVPQFRNQEYGHIIVLTSVTGHIGTPGLGIHCAASWALEGFCDSLAFEIAPFNIKLTIVQPNLEVNVLTNKIHFIAQMPEYAGKEDGRPAGHVIREKLRSAIDKVSAGPPADHTTIWDGDETVRPNLSEETIAMLVEETVWTLISIGGDPSPPARHIVGKEGVVAVKEKLKTLSEELEDFSDVGISVDFTDREILAMDKEKEARDEMQKQEQGKQDKQKKQKRQRQQKQVSPHST